MFVYIRTKLHFFSFHRVIKLHKCDFCEQKVLIVNGFVMYYAEFS